MRAKTGLFYLYLVAFSYCEELRKTVTIPLVDSSKGSTVPEVQLVEYTGSTDCDHRLEKHFFLVNGTSIEIKDVSGKSICDRQHFFNEAHPQVFSPDALKKRYLPNPVIIKFSVELFGGSAIAGSVTLASVATVGAIGIAIAAAWYGAMKLQGDQSQPIGKKQKRAPTPQLLPRQKSGIEVCYADDPDTSHHVLEAVKNYGQANLEAVGTQVVQLIEDQTPDAYIGLCGVELTGDDNSQYQAVLGTATLVEELKDGDFALADECKFRPY